VTIIFIQQTAVRFTYLNLKLLLHFNSDPAVEIRANFRRTQCCKVNTAIWLAILPNTSLFERPDSVIRNVTVQWSLSIGTSYILILFLR